MHKKTLRSLISVLLALVVGLSLLTGCGTKSAEEVEKQEDARTIQVYLWTNALYETYAPYIQSQLPVLAARCCSLEGQPDEPCPDQ